MPDPDATRILTELREGDESAADRLLPVVYDYLRGLARSYFRGQPASHTLQPTALVHEAFLRMVGAEDVHWEDRTHFVGTCAVAMRRILADYARRKGTAKRGGGWRRVTLAGVETPRGEGDRLVDLLSLDEALSELTALNERQARIVELRLFGGLNIEEIAFKLDVSRATVENDWYMARSWLSYRLDQRGDTDS